MKNLILTAAILFTVLSVSQAQKIKGSDTILPLSQQEAESFMKINPSRTVTVTGGGSGVGISALLEGTTDIAQASRQIKFTEHQKIQEFNLRNEGYEVDVAYSAEEALRK